MLVAVVVVVGVAGGVLSVVRADVDRAVRVVVRLGAGGSAEVALQQRDAAGVWGDRLLPKRRVVGPGAATGRWHASSVVSVGSAAGTREVRAVLRRHRSGAVEVGLQQREMADVWGDRVLPARRFVSPGAEVGRWHASSSVVLEGPPTALDLPPHLPLALHVPPPEPDDDTPAALVTPTGVPVAVTGRTGEGYEVRTPCGATAVVSGGAPIGPVRVVVDPGHGGRFETGAVGPNGLVEGDLNLTLSGAVLAEFDRRGIAAATTRTGDYGVLLSVRAAFADALGADALISLHHNGPTPGAAESPGTEVYAQSAPEGGFRFTSGRLAGLLYEEITTALGRFDGVAWSGLPDAGVLRVLLPAHVQSSRDGLFGGDAYGLIRAPAVPAVLVEYGYLSNAPEAALFATDDYIRVAAAATVDAVEAYLTTDRSGSGFVQRPRVFDPPWRPPAAAKHPSSSGDSPPDVMSSAGDGRDVRQRHEGFSAPQGSRPSSNGGGMRSSYMAGSGATTATLPLRLCDHAGAGPVGEQVRILGRQDERAHHGLAELLAAQNPRRVDGAGGFGHERSTTLGVHVIGLGASGAGLFPLRRVTGTAASPSNRRRATGRCA